MSRICFVDLSHYFNILLSCVEVAVGRHGWQAVRSQKLAADTPKAFAHHSGQTEQAVRFLEFAAGTAAFYPLPTKATAWQADNGIAIFVVLASQVESIVGTRLNSQL
jgi:hypothetical protein